MCMLTAAGGLLQVKSLIFSPLMTYYIPPMVSVIDQDDTFYGS